MKNLKYILPCPISIGDTSKTFTHFYTSYHVRENNNKINTTVKSQGIY